jgi:hypothetical protein
MDPDPLIESDQDPGHLFYRFLEPSDLSRRLNLCDRALLSVCRVECTQPSMAPHRELVMIEALEFGERFSNIISCGRIPLIPDKGPYYGFAFKKRKPKCFFFRCNHDLREFRNKLIVFVVEVAAVEGN